MADHRLKLTIETLQDLAEGQAGAVINAALKSAIVDTEDRGLEDGKPRKVTIEVCFEKISHSEVKTTIKAKTTIPPYQTMPTIGRLEFDNANREVVMQFSPHAANNPNQDSLPQMGRND